MENIIGAYYQLFNLNFKKSLCKFKLGKDIQDCFSTGILLYFNKFEKLHI
jgi:hypothetical protein